MTNANLKSKTTAYLLWFFLGGFGAHRFYLGKNPIVYIIAIVAFILIFVSIIIAAFIPSFAAISLFVGQIASLASSVLGFVILVLWIYDAFKIPTFIEECNLGNKN